MRWTVLVAALLAGCLSSPNEVVDPEPGQPTRLTAVDWTAQGSQCAGGAVFLPVPFDVANTVLPPFYRAADAATYMDGPDTSLALAMVYAAECADPGFSFATVSLGVHPPEVIGIVDQAAYNFYSFGWFAPEDGVAEALDQLGWLTQNATIGHTLAIGGSQVPTWTVDTHLREATLSGVTLTPLPEQVGANQGIEAFRFWVSDDHGTRALDTADDVDDLIGPAFCSFDDNSTVHRVFGYDLCPDLSTDTIVNDQFVSTTSGFFANSQDANLALRLQTAPGAYPTNG